MLLKFFIKSSTCLLFLLLLASLFTSLCVGCVVCLGCVGCLGCDIVLSFGNLKDFILCATEIILLLEIASLIIAVPLTNRVIF